MIWLATCAAMYGCVPETGHIPPVAGIPVGLFCVERATRTTSPRVTQGATVGVLVAAVHYGAAGFERAIVGGAFAFWPALIVPVLTAVVPETATRREHVRWTVAAIGAVAAAIVSRTGALEPGAGPALSAVAVWAPVSLAAGAVTVRVWRDAR